MYFVATRDAPRVQGAGWNVNPPEVPAHKVLFDIKAGLRDGQIPMLHGGYSAHAIVLVKFGALWKYNAHLVQVSPVSFASVDGMVLQRQSHVRLRCWGPAPNATSPGTAWTLGSHQTDRPGRPLVRCRLPDHVT